MPELLRYRGFKFYFYAKEGVPLEPPHVHVAKSGSEAEFWLTPRVRLVGSKRVDPRTFKMLEAIVEQHRAEFEDRWHVFFS